MYRSIDWLIEQKRVTALPGDYATRPNEFFLVRKWKNDFIININFDS